MVKIQIASNSPRRRGDADVARANQWHLARPGHSHPMRLSHRRREMPGDLHPGTVDQRQLATASYRRPVRRYHRHLARPGQGHRWRAG